MSAAPTLVASPAGAASVRAPRRGALASFLPPALGIIPALFTVGVFLSDARSARLQYDRAALAAGEVWRLVTCHWTHWSPDHLAWDAATFALLGWACARRSVRQYIATVCVSAMLIPLAVWQTHPDMVTYRGLSGIDSALLALLAVGVLRDEAGPGGRRAVAWACAAVLLGFAAKLAYELASGATLFVDAAAAGFVPVPLAHASGALVGAAVALVPIKPRRSP